MRINDRHIIQWRENCTTCNRNSPPFSSWSTSKS